ncbi:MAG: YraN family protein [Candidatus Saccharimonadales bacterium]
MNTTESGRKAEEAARTYLDMRGYRVVEQNFRRPHTEIDIVAEKDNVIYFVEVKYRIDYEQGGGLEAITASKLQRMRRGAETWVAEYKWRGEYCLAAVEIAGREYMVMNFIDNAY